MSEQSPLRVVPGIAGIRTRGTEGARDIVVIGASLGGIEALTSLAAQLPADFAACILVVQHTADASPGLLPSILERSGPLPAVMAQDGMPLRPGHIVVAPPGRHMLLTEDGIRVTFGARENRARPAIDPLFRTAALHYRSRVIGVVLSGTLGDGAVGLDAVARCGGVTVVQSPDDALAPEMPMRALAVVPEALQVPLADLGALLQRLALEPAQAPPPLPPDLEAEVDIMERVMTTDEVAPVPGHTTDFTCPDCGGTIRELGEGDEPRRYRCRVGHAYSADMLVSTKDEALEQALWVALQTLQERAQMLEAFAGDERKRRRARTASDYDSRARETRNHAERLRNLIESVASGDPARG